ncbi:sulfatase [bacterium]|nr:sulfatase [bacterium]
MIERVGYHQYRLSAHLWLSSIFVFAYACCLLVGLGSCSPKDKTESVRVDPRPNIFLITTDSVRSDFLGCYGNHWIKTPNMDQISRKGHTFTAMYNQSPYTVPALASIMTSLYPQQHNARNVLLEQKNTATATISSEIVDLPLQEKVKTWAAFMKERGYTTIASVGGFTVTSAFSGLNSGFMYYDQATDQLFRSGEILIDGIERQLAAQKNQPLFCWLHFFDTHFPYQVEGPCSLLYQDSRYVSILPKDCQYDRTRIQNITNEQNPVTAVNQTIARYAASISWIDTQIAQVQRRLIRQLSPKRNFMIVTSDHGEGLIEHFEFFDHGLQLYNTTTRVPCLFSFGQQVEPHNSQVINHVCRHVDLWPTLDDYLGYSRAQDDRTGRSMKPILDGTGVFSEPVLLEGKVVQAKVPETRNEAIVSDPWKLMITHSENEVRESLYDLNDDPGELLDLAGKQSQVIKELKQSLNTLKQLKSEIDDSDVMLTSQDEDTKDKLRSLGYLGD